MTKGVANDRHPFVEGGGVRIAKDGRRLPVCASCGRPSIGTSHPPRPGRLTRAGGGPRIASDGTVPPRAEPKFRRTSLTSGHPFVDDGVGTTTAGGRHWAVCSQCGKTRIAHTWAAKLGPAIEPATAAEPVPETPPAPTNGVAHNGAAKPAEPVDNRPRPYRGAAPGEYVAAALALDAILALPADRVSWRIRLAVVNARDALPVPVFASLNAPDAPADPDPVTDTILAVIPRLAPSTPRVADDGGNPERIIRGIRNDRVRELAKRAHKAGWKVSLMGSGHIAVDRGRDRLVLSGTMGDSRRGGHAWGNAKAAARRAGLDVTGL